MTTTIHYVGSDANTFHGLATKIFFSTLGAMLKLLATKLADCGKFVDSSSTNTSNILKKAYPAQTESISATPLDPFASLSSIIQTPLTSS